MVYKLKVWYNTYILKKNKCIMNIRVVIHL